ncbi:DNA gyrase inhibitor YacG [Haliangium sp.]|uniref:DNA gyrase inhibitor YacG n=1 Tax=Haliangium sp. TaxID=2663208 RepID=UPI003D0975C0
MAHRCPICNSACPAHADNRAYPFCSHRCQMVDLGRWLDGDYRIPGDPVDDIAARGDYLGGGGGGDDDEIGEWGSSSSQRRRH